MEFSGERYLSNMNNAEMSYEHWHRYFYATQFVKEKDVLDIASGEGYGANLMARTAKTVLGVDISQEAIDFAKECYIRNNLSFLQGSVENIPVDGVKKFDVVVSFETIEHVNTGLQIAFLKEVKRLLKDDGIFIVSSPNKLFYSDISKFKNEFHFKEFYEEEFIDFLGKYFKHVSLLGQKIFTGSDIWHLDFSKREYSFSEYQIMNNGQRFVANDDKKEALFLVAVCSDVEVKFVEHSLLFDKSLSLLWENEKRLRDQKLASLRLSLAECTNELNSIYASKKWKLIIKVAAPVLFARQGISKIKSWMKRQLVTVFLKKCVNLTRRFFEITTDLGLRVAMAEVFLTLTGKNSVLIKPSSIPRDLSEDAFSIPEHLGFVEIFSALFKRLKLTVDAEKTWKLISSQLDFAALYKLQVEIFTLHRFFLTANAMSPCKLIQASTLPQRGGVPRKRNICNCYGFV